MKNLIATKKSTNLKVLFGTLDEFKFRHNQLKNIFRTGKEYQLFAEPLLLNDNKEIAWYSEIDAPHIPFSQLTESEQGKALEILKTKVDKMFQFTEQHHSGQEKELFLKYLKQYAEIPDYEDVWAIKRDGKIEDVVITQWGCINDSFDAVDGLIRKIELGQRAAMIFKAMYDDGFVASNETFLFSYDKEQMQATSDGQGIINLGQYKIYTYFTAKYPANESGKLLGHFLCDNTQHILTIPAIPAMKFRVVNDKGVVLPGMGIIFETNGQKIQENADLQGMIALPRIRPEQQVSAYQIEDQKIINLQQYVFQDKSKVYDIIIPEKPVEAPPPPAPEKPLPITNMKFKLVDKKMNPYANARVQIFYQSTVLEAMTDADGRFALQNLLIGEIMQFHIHIGKKIVKLKNVKVVPEGMPIK